MKKLPLIITIILVATLVGGYFAYDYYFKQKNVSVWELVPQQTTLVYEVGECTNCADKAQQAPIVALYQALLFPQDVNDSLRKQFDFLKSTYRGELVSLHITSKEDFDFVFYIPLRSMAGFNATIAGWKQRKSALLSEREFNGSRIQEIRMGTRVFSWTTLDELWVGSFTPFLVEDVIRAYTSDEQSTFRAQVADVYKLPRIKNDAGDVYVHLQHFTDLLSIFIDDVAVKNLPLGLGSLLDVKDADGVFTLNGFSLAHADAPSELLSIFRGQTPMQFGSKQFISERTLLSTDFGISDGSMLYSRLAIASNKSIQDTLRSLSSADIAPLYAGLGPELSVNYLEGRGAVLSKVLIFQSSNTKDWLAYLGKLSSATEQQDTAFFEQYASFEIREVDINRLPEKLFAPLVTGFSHTYYTSVGNVIIVAEQLEDLKNFLRDIENEEVWGKSVAFNKFLESTLLEANISYYVNTPLIWSYLSGRLKPRWKKFLTENRAALQRLGLGAVQFSYLNESFYTNTAWKYQSARAGSQPDRSPVLVSANFDQAIIGRPFIIRNHATRQDEVIVQDSLYNVYQVSADGKVLWKVPVDGPVQGTIEQIDFFGNGKLQVFFTTTKSLHVIDRLGKYVSPYPVDIKAQAVEYSSVVDYDKSKKYRFLLTDRTGKLWMYDKEGANLDGWKPYNATSQLIAGARHYRIRGKDYIIAIRKDGWAHVLTRRGEPVKGFPLNLDARPEGDFYLEVGNSLATTYIIAISRDGFRVRFNLEGKVINKETLVKPSIDTKFSLVRGKNEKAYLICRQDAKKLTVLDEELKELIVNEYVGNNVVDVHYFDASAGRRLIVITDRTQNLAYVYTASGKLLTPVPVDAEAVEMIISPSSTEAQLITTFENTLTIQPIRY